MPGPLQEFFQAHEWTQGVFARTEEMEPCMPADQNAACFCLAGAVVKITGVDPMEWKDTELGKNLLHKVKDECDDTLSTPGFNDQQLKSKDELMAFLEKYDL